MGETAKEWAANILASKNCAGVTKSGNQCRNPNRSFPSLGLFNPYCSVHATEKSQQIAEFFRAAYALGVQRGEESIKYRVQDIQRDADARVKAELESRGCKHMRTHDDAGDQLVVIDRGWTYDWPKEKEPLRVGDIVVVPGTQYGPSEFEAEIIAVSSDYVGYLKRVRRVVKRAAEVS